MQNARFQARRPPRGPRWRIGLTAQGRANTPARTRGPERPLRRFPMNVLLIDDDPNLRKSLRLALETMNHRVTEACDGTQAQDFLGHGQFDIAFLDLRLGREKGLDVLPALLRLAPGMPVVVVTAYATIETAVEAMRRGACDY